ncbi:MAG TPA: hypothetical protein VMT37_16050 [Solirubrobacterales bacterium]|nr:hypothetical protein [Solirubrobacterales bacterium]
MKLSNLFNKAKKTIDDRGGMDALKADAEELKDVATSKGSLTDKAKAATDAIKEPGAHQDAADASTEADPRTTPPAS